MSKVRKNAIIMAAGKSSRFDKNNAGLHKAFVQIGGETLIERQIRQLKEAGIDEIIIVTGHLKEQFSFLADLAGIRLIYNDEYMYRNNNSSIWAARDYISDTYICSCDNYFPNNPFPDSSNESYYSAQFSEGHTEEWCITSDEHGFIDAVSIGGCNSWYMIGHAYWNNEFSRAFLNILEREYDYPDTAPKLWEQIYSEHLDKLKMRIKGFPQNSIYEFDTTDDLASYTKTIHGD